MIDTQREAEAETQAEEEAGSMQGAWCGTWSWDSILRLHDHALGQRQALNHWATGATLKFLVKFQLVNI